MKEVARQCGARLYGSHFKIIRKEARGIKKGEAAGLRSIIEKFDTANLYAKR